MKSGNAAVAKIDEVSEIRARPQPIGYEKADYSVLLADDIRPEHLEDAQCWTTAKHLTASDHGPCLMPGDTVRGIHRDYFAFCVVDSSGPGEPCHVIVTQVVPRKKHEARERALVPAEHYVELNPKTGRYDYGFFRGSDNERVSIGDARTFDQAADECRKHAARTAKR